MKTIHSLTLPLALDEAERLARRHGLAGMHLCAPRMRIAAYMTGQPFVDWQPRRTLEVRYAGRKIAEITLTGTAPDRTRVDIDPVEGLTQGIDAAVVEQALSEFIAHLHRAVNAGLMPVKPGTGESIEVWFAWYAECKLRGRSVTLKEIAREVNLSYSHVKALHARYAAEHKPAA